MLDVTDARALITTSISDADLASIIEREEAWLARRIGPIEGQRVETFIPSIGDEILLLQRPTSSFTIEDDSGDLAGSTALRGWGDIVLESGAWSGPTVVTYTPSDEGEVIKALITLLRLTIAESGYQAQTASGFSVTVSPADQKAMRWQAWQQLRRPRVPTTISLSSVIATGGRRIQASSSVAEGS